MRLFLAIWPDAAALSALSELARPEVPGVRWTRPDQWHVTMRFLGEADPTAVSSAIDPRRLPPAPWAALGPATDRLGRNILQAPVSGLDALARSLVDMTRDVGEPPDGGRFRGHVTLARARRPADLSGLLGQSVSSGWRVEEVTLVSSLSPSAGSPVGRPSGGPVGRPFDGPVGRPFGGRRRYEVIGRWPLL